MARNIAGFFSGLFIAVLVFGFAARTQSHAREYNANICAGPPLTTEDARKKALEVGYRINPQFACIDRNSYNEINRRRNAEQHARSAVTGANNLPTLAQARRDFHTAISQRSSAPPDLPTPPAELFTRIDYRSADHSLPAFVTPDPHDGFKHPAIIWLGGEDINSLGKSWVQGPESNDQSASAFRNAGVVVMVPVLHGGNKDATGREFFMGEVDDVLAAAEQLAKLDYVNADRIFLGGHSTGGTLALLTAETSDRFAGVFAFGPIAEVDHYPSLLVPIDFQTLDVRERILRSPLYWLHGITRPTYLVEGKEMPGNRQEVETLCAKTNNPNIHCVLVGQADHFSVLSKVTTVVAARLAISDTREFAMRAEEFQ